MGWYSHQSLKILRTFLEDPTEALSGADLIRKVQLLSGTTYPILLRFEKQGLLASEWESARPQDLGRPRRRLYRLTGEGVREARRAIDEISVGLASTAEAKA